MAKRTGDSMIAGGLSCAFSWPIGTTTRQKWWRGKFEEARKADDFIIDAGSLAGLGRTAEAEIVVERALTRFPEISIETQVSHPEFIDHERRRFADTMRKAGFPVCASEAVLALNPDLIRMPECAKAQAAAN